MNQLLQITRTTLILLSVVLLGSSAVPVSVQAVIPPPDGGYPGGNTAEGNNALLSLTTGQYNTAVGLHSLSSNTTGTFNTAIGSAALRFNTTSDSNTAVGSYALFSNRFGDHNIAVGDSALYFNNNGDENTAVGDSAMSYNTTGGTNTAVGESALLRNTQGDFNTAIGAATLIYNTTGLNNTALGYSAGGNVKTAHDVICIGYHEHGADVSNTCFIASIRGVTTINNDALPVYIDSAGQLGTVSSSRRFKRDIKPIGNASESLLALKPVSFEYKAHRDDIPQFGLLAEDVAEINRNLVIYDTDGRPFAVRYDAVNAMLLNEFLKEHRTVHEHAATIARLEKQIEALTTGLQKVSAELELSKAAPQTVLNND
jgi:Chaperone of endosialidase